MKKHQFFEFPNYSKSYTFEIGCFLWFVPYYVTIVQLLRPLRRQVLALCLLFTILKLFVSLCHFKHMILSRRTFITISAPHISYSHLVSYLCSFCQPRHFALPRKTKSLSHTCRISLMRLAVRSFCVTVVSPPGQIARSSRAQSSLRSWTRLCTASLASCAPPTSHTFVCWWAAPQTGKEWEHWIHIQWKNDTSGAKGGEAAPVIYDRGSPAASHSKLGCAAPGADCMWRILSRWGAQCFVQAHMQQKRSCGPQNFAFIPAPL